MASYEDALKKYPDWAWAFNIPDVGNELRRGVDDPNYDPIPAILQTNWYHTTQASARQWDALKSTDPASADARRREQEARINDMRAAMGIHPDPEWVRNEADQALRMGWSEDQIRDQLAAQLQYNPNVGQAVGSISTTMAQLKETASNYYIKLSDDSAFDMAKAVVSGEHSPNDWIGIWQNQASQQFPAIADAIKKGITPKQYFSPVQDRIAEQLGVSRDSIDLMDPKWSPVIDTTDDKGVRRPMNYSEVDTFTRSTDDWKKSTKGQDAGLGLYRTLATTFGVEAA